MPTKRVRQSERRRCAKACGNCKRRKERCDGQQPCRRCVIRRVEGDCAFAGPPTTVFPPGSSSSSSISSTSGPARRSPPRTAAALDGSPPGRDVFHSSYDNSAPFRGAATTAAAASAGSGVSPSHHRRASSQVCHVSPGTAVVPQLSRLIGDGRGRFMFIGDAANLAFLKVIRRLVRDRVGSCPFTDDPLRHLMVEATPEGRPRWIITNPADIPAKPSPEQARYLLRWYLRATNCILEVLDEAELLADLERWLRGEPTSYDDNEAANCIFYLVFGIGAQRCPDDRDADAERYFNYGRFLAVSYAMENPTNNTIRSYVLLTAYLLGASRRNSAFMHLGVAVRAAYALGIHRRDSGGEGLFSQREQDARERLWKSLRVLDLFLAASLGRPLATSETRDTSTGGGSYSASLDLCAIFESILNDVYARRMVTTDTLERISEQHRRWAARFADGLAADGLQPGPYIEADDGERYPNIALYHMKEAYYWSIMLLSRPFLIDFVSRNIARSSTWSDDGGPPLSSHSDQLLVHACVDSAIRTVDLLSGLISDKNVSKRHPFVINSVFVSALVLGLAVFGDLDATFPLDGHLADAEALLRRFSQHDRVANREFSIVEYLRGACALYVERRARRKMECQGALVGELFGSVHEGATQPGDASRQGFSRQARGLSGQRPQSTSDADDIASLDQSISLATGGADAHHQLANVTQALTPSTDILLSMSPRTLLFDSYSHDMPFFPTMDASLAHLGYTNEMMIADAEALLDPAC
ncbi:C6 transcription factor [Colletotrichum musicola]|uniref:C6 transcription factor n=1 Tax=Colletotrichum musicola TaxID=2175873 RepID=A0A8H6U7I5_9PEZI|nr:C6 transcription factor [Colletotrichum musicola]